MLVPFPFVVPVESAAQADRVRRLEQALVLSLGALETLVRRLDEKLGAEFLGPDLKPLTNTGSDAELEAVLDSIQRTITAGKSSTAAREFRDAFGCTWDEANHAVRHWSGHPREQKLRWLRLARFIKALEAGAE